MSIFILLLFLTTLFIVLSAFFSASETALFSIPRERILSFQTHEKRSYNLVYSLLLDGQRTLLLILLGNTFVNITLAGIVYSWMSLIFREQSALVSLFAGTGIIVVFGEIIPKNYALRNNEALAVSIAPYFHRLKRLLSPVLSFIARLNQFFLKKFRVHLKSPSPFVTFEELKWGIINLRKRGAITPSEQEMIQGMLEQGALAVKKFMTHRSMIPVFLPTKRCSDAIREMSELKQTFALVSDSESKLHVKGFVRLHSLLKSPPHAPVGRHCYGAHWVPDSVEMAQLLAFMFRKKVTEVCVLDEFGGYSGVFSLSVGLRKIFQSAQQTTETIHFKIPAASMVFDGLQDIESMEEWLPPTLSQHSQGARTLNGLLSNYLGRIPETGDKFFVDEWYFYVVKAEPTRISTVLIRKKIT
ncbi:CNNM domain-containing protein [Chitinispirillales bacterium ANBcel5]|uniref:CNNM domain-containing protein n=1 Tax=Cellulosispirillum alkaliphilum TaxID=3039283 RepID=UPI002A50098A|nr:CNNM domain-containing protein [Chitinispirillales bacterium ANBcel5]